MSANENRVPLEVLQPDISAEIIQTSLAELKNWIEDGKLQPHHQVRVKNLSWLEAHKIPALKPLFEAKKKGQTNQQNNFFSSPLSNTSGFDKSNPAAFSLNKTSTFADGIADKNKQTKPAEPSAVFKAFEKKALSKSKQSATKNGQIKPKVKKTESNNKTSKLTPERSQKPSVIQNTLVFLGGCVLMLLLSYGVSYLWVYQLTSPAAFDEKSVPEVAGLEHKLTSEKLDLRLKASANDQETIAQKYAQLEKKYEAQRKTAVENHKVKLADADFTQTLSFTSVALLALFLMGRIFYGKTSKPVEDQTPSEKSAKRSEKLSGTNESDAEDLSDGEDEFIEIENDENDDSTVEDDESELNPRPAKSQKKAKDQETDDSGEFSDFDKDEEEPEESKTTERCLLHPNKASVFVCETCENNYCGECMKTFGEVENCCPFCKVVCKSLEANNNKKTKKKENKPVNLLELNKGNADFIVYEYEEERSKTAGVIQAFVVALLLSAAVSILWTYKIHPYLQSPNKDTAQNVSPDENGGQIPLNADPATYNKEIDDTLKTGPCIDPETKQPFECDEETRRALYEHTRKTQSVEKARKDVDKTAELITGPKDENKAADHPQIAAAKAEQSKKETRQLILSFSISFVLIFGLMLATVFLGKDKKTFLNQNKEEDREPEAEENFDEEIFEEEIEATEEETE